MQQGLAAWRATGAELVQPYFRPHWPRRMGKGGSRKQGPNPAGRGARGCARTGERRWDAELYRLKG